ncbi:MAG: TetR/AcrR family transcriptional regulator [Cyclobacteriaceae bacterium]|nr:TetR/AcrR family transcriptional regulator [Cyclobacteriaceae bacterium]
MKKDISTEEKIKQAASKVFVKKGLAGARMQEIADEAGINKAMLHYYYRSKDKLFHSIFMEVVKEFTPKIIGVLNADLPLQKKIERYVEEYIGMLKNDPAIPLFIFNEMKNNPKEFIEKVGIVESGVLDKLNDQLIEEKRVGNIRFISVHEFMINLVSLCVFPFLAKPMFQGIFNASDDEFYKFMEMRKKSIPVFMMAAIS